MATDILVVIRKGPYGEFQAAEDMLAEDSTIGLFLLQEAVRFYQPCAESPNHPRKDEEYDRNVLTPDAALRSIDLSAADSALEEGSHETLVDRLTACDRVVGIL